MNKDNNNKEDIKNCSFCGVSEEQTSILIGDDEDKSFICLSCVNTVYEMSNQIENINEENEDNIKILEEDSAFDFKPKNIKEELDKYIVGQDEAKITVSIAAYNHYKRLEYNSGIEDDENEKVEISKSNILFIGPSGSGKTLIVETLSKLLNVPFAIADATTLTESGYVGDDVDSILTKLIEKADGDIKKAEKGIIFIDEIDKISKRDISGRQNSRDVAGEGVQQSLLKILEGKEVKINIKKNSHFDKEEIINTKDILFIGAGAFEGLSDMIDQRKNTKSLGFNNRNLKVVNNKKKILHSVKTTDLIDYGLIPEILGRLPIIGVFDELSNEQMIDILKTPKNSLIKQYTKLFELDDVELKFTEEALSEIVNISKERKLGARGLRSVLDEILKDLMFNLEDYKNSKVTITLNNVQETISKHG